MKDVRAVAARTLQKVEQGRSLSQLLPSAEGDIRPADRALLQELCFGTLRYFPKLDAILEERLKQPFKPKDRDIQMLLAVGLYQLFYMRTPDHAAIHATVEAARKLGKKWACGLINGVLRGVQKNPPAESELSPAAAASHPMWLFGKLRKAWPDQLDAIVEGNNSRPPMTLRVNIQQQSRSDYLEQLAAADIEATATPFAEQGIQLAQPIDVSQLPNFSEGAVSVQDEAAQLSAQLLNPQPGDRVLDACCAPGGKSCHLLEQQPELAELVALDSDPQRLERVTENLTRLHLQATLVSGDARQPEQWWDGKPFQRMLVDAPCSATGVIRRHPDIKLLRKPDDIAALATLQGEILDQLWPLLASGGTLLYATCSLMREENERVIAAFLERQSDACEQLIEAEWGEARPHGRQLFPQLNGHDGFYYALLVKRAA